MNLAQMSREELIEALEPLIESERVLRVRDRALAEKERLVHDLRVHQLELELQNRTLRESQAELEASRARYADLYDFAPVAHCTLDDKGCVRDLNLTGATMIGRDRAEILGLPFLTLVRVAEPSVFWGHLRRCALTRGPVVSELRFSTARRDDVDVQAVSVPVLDAGGAVVAFRTAFTDLTERKEAEAERDRALAAERRLRAQLEALDRAGVAVSAGLATLGGECARAVLQVIVEQARLLADAKFAALGIGDDPERPFSPWIFSGIDAEAAAAIGPAPRALGVLGVVARSGALRMPDLREHPAFRGLPANHPPMKSFLGVPVHHGGKRLGTLYVTEKRGAEAFDAEDQHILEMLAERVGSAVEIARLREGEVQLLEQARAALHARDAMLAVVAHDLRTPLTSIVLGAALMPQGKHIEVIARTAQRMSRLVDDLLSAATIEAGRLVREPRPYGAALLIEEAVQVTAPLAAARGLQLTHDAPAELPAVLCDPDRILQVLSNLLGNAAKFTPSGGEIRLAATRAEGCVRFAVSDTGPGIREEHLAHLFEPYWQERPARSPGVGLGLYIAKGIVDALGGRIWVESKVGAGTTFFFTLREAPAAAAP
jgi:PAS domain S-box-containing protein